MMNFDHSI
jgi:hypothetical protein